jgi:hypothetical protein
MSTDPVDPVDPLLARARAWTPAGETPALNDLYAMGDDDDAYNAAMKDVADMATTGHVPPPTSEPRNII